MEFRLSRIDEYAAMRRLWRQAFGEEEPWTGWYFSKHYQADQTWVGVDDGKVVAQAHLLPYRLMLRGSWHEAVYFVGVCVEEKLRGAGIGRDLMASALAELKRTGTGISILQPRWPDFYRKLGWNYCYSRQRYNLPAAEADLLLPEVVQSIGWTPDEQAWEPLSALYECFVRLRHGYALRGRKDWENLLSDHRSEGGYVGIVSHNGIPDGYVLYNTFGNALHIREMVWRDAWMVDAAWKCMIGQEGPAGAKTLEWDDPSGDSGSVLYSGSHSEPFLMGRVTDIQSVLAALKYPAGLSAEMNLTIYDSLAPWNCGSFRWSIRQGKGALSPVPFAESAGPALGIGVMSQLIFGERPVRDILAAGNGSAYREEDVKILEQLFPACRNYISEYF